MQLPGMLEIAFDSLTNVPVAVRLIGNKRLRPVTCVTSQASYLVLSVLINTVIQQRVLLSESYTRTLLASNLPHTRRVYQKEGSIVMEVDCSDFVSLHGRT